MLDSLRGVGPRVWGAVIVLGLALSQGLLATSAAHAEESGSAVEVTGSESHAAPAPEQNAGTDQAGAEAAPPTVSAASTLDQRAGGLSWGDFALSAFPGQLGFVQAALEHTQRGLSASAASGRETLQRRLAQLRLNKDLAPGGGALGPQPSRNTWPSGKAAEWLSRYYLSLPPLDSAHGVYGDAQARQYADAEYALTNEIRVGKGLAPLRRDAHLDAIAQAHAVHMAQSGFFEHANPYGMEVFERIDVTDAPRWYSAGENIAAGQRSPDEAHRSWMKSKGHKRNILNKNYESIGIGAFYAPHTDYGWYWVQVFASFDRDSSQHDWIDPGERQ